jgi:peptidoglycan/xylan/chitin deacetylase (PgdA/CDA1 family)
MKQILLAVCLMASVAMASENGATRVAKWKDDKACAFGLFFDDSMSTHIKNVLPELKKRGLVGTFYINAGGGLYKAYKGAWEKDIPEAGGVLANHTFTHKGATTPEELDAEVKQCDDVIRAALGAKCPKILSFGRPGVPEGKWKITKEQLAECLKKYNSVLRPDCTFAGIHLKTAKDMIGVLNKTIESGKFGHVSFHGVGGEWLSIDMPAFLELLNEVDAKKDKLWSTDHISAMLYENARKTAEAKVESANAKEIKIALKSAEPSLLTLVTNVPADWKKCEVKQGAAKATVAVNNGVAIYDALPGSDAIVLTPAQ